MWIKTDSAYVHQLLSQDNSVHNAYSSLVYAINRLRNQNWNVEIKLVYREANMCADRLAKHGHSLPLGITLFDSLPACISLEFFTDLIGQGYPRTITM